MNEMWNQFFSLRHDRPRTLQLQIRQQLIDAISSGLIRPKESLPSSRSLANELKVARNTVIAAYKELEFDGYIIARERKGYFVSSTSYDNLVTGSTNQQDETPPQWMDKLINKKPSAKINITKAKDWQKEPYPFTVGQLDHSLIPYNEWREVVRLSTTVPEIKKWNIDHVDTDDPSLIKQLQSKVLPKRGIWANKNQILITAGSQNAIYILANLLVDSTTRVGIENPGYPDVRNILSYKTDKIKPIDVDKQGIVVDSIDPNCDLIYTTPSHQYPTGVTMSMERRKQLLNHAKKHNSVIIEDDYEAEINFLKKANPSLKSLDDHNNVVYVGSFSKAFAPGLRLGYLVAPEGLITEARALRRLMLRHIPANNQRSVALFIALGHYHNMFTKIQRTNKERWGLINEIIKKEPLLSCAPTPGGSTFWIKIPRSIDCQLLCQELLKKGVVVRPGHASFIGNESSENYLHLGYSAINTRNINRGMEILINLIKEMAVQS